MGLRKMLRRLTKKRGTDTPWMSSMTDKYTKPSSSSHADGGDSGGSPQATVAAFSPIQQAATNRGRGNSVLVYQKSPLLVATPPQVTRALAYSHGFILPLNQIAGLLSWTTDDVWESFLLLPAFWFATLYGDDVIRWAGPLVVVVLLILGMYSRRYSPLSSTLWSGMKKGKRSSDPRKSLDEILETLQTFTQRCDVLLDPFLRLTEFLSTQNNATSATTRPALKSLFLRILCISPIWTLLTLQPLHIVTSQRVILTLGTIGLSWHSRPARVTRTILWRSRTVRRAMSLVTGLTFVGASPAAITTPALTTQTKDSNVPTPGIAKDAKPGIRFAFTVYENQRRWLGLGWTPSLLAYERQGWTDEHMNTCPSTEAFELPETEHDTTKWRWVARSAWKLEGATTEKERSAKRIGGGGGGDDSGWTYYDNKWHDPRKVDGWDRYTRRRKWIRDAELADVSASAPSETVTSPASTISDASGMTSDGETTSPSSTAKRKAGWFVGTAKQRATSLTASGKAKLKKLELDRSDAGSGKAGSADSVRSARDDSGDDVLTPTRYREFEWDRSIGEGVMEGLS
ncbi:hypothetical protein LTR73_000897 [Friedmanniomyces endolithicus]|nr:hypothetical protein LTR73_000897 [Friedmanniomyces endolithicus]